LGLIDGVVLPRLPWRPWSSKLSRVMVFCVRAALATPARLACSRCSTDGALHPRAAPAKLASAAAWASEETDIFEVSCVVD
jgi:hypothetical protein